MLTLIDWGPCPCCPETGLRVFILEEDGRYRATIHAHSLSQAATIIGN